MNLKEKNLVPFGKKTLYISSDYHLFEFVDFNRPVDSSHVATLEKSIKKFGFKGALQVIKTDIWDGVMKLKVVEGQHRFLACKRLGVPFTFELTEFTSEEDLVEFIADLNNSQKGWNTTQFLKVWSGLKRPEYVKLKKVFEDTGFQITPLIEAFTFSGKHVDFRKGKMKFPNEVESDKIISQLIDLNAYLPTKAFIRRAVIKLMRQDKYNHSKMVKAVAQYKQIMGGFTENESDFTTEFQKLINNN